MASLTLSAPWVRFTAHGMVVVLTLWVLLRHPWWWKSSSPSATAARGIEELANVCALFSKLIHLLRSLTMVAFFSHPTVRQAMGADDMQTRAEILSAHRKERSASHE